MMLRRLPVIPTLLVLLAVGVMLRLGLWQLDRMHEKEALLARYAAAQSLSADAPWPRDAAEAERVYYRHATIRCLRVGAITPMAGTSASGQAGIAHVATCDLADGGKANVVLGWSRDPAPRQWDGGEVVGLIAPGGDAGPRLVADPPLAGLEANARPDPASMPNNHLSYAVQWFLFAAVALVIYALAVRKRLAGPGREG
jgi:surfeit locus 1 family protein